MLGMVMPAWADWRLEVRRDSMTDETKRSAVVMNDGGHSLTVYRAGDGRAWLTFRLSPGTAEILASNRGPMMRIDRWPAHDLDGSRKLTESLGMAMYSYEPKWINVVIWHGRADEGMGTQVAQLMHGRQVVVRYYLMSGGHKETSFALRGAAPAIAQALGIDVPPRSAAEVER